MGLSEIEKSKQSEIKQTFWHDQIFCVEGEQCANFLWSLGLTAVTTIDGCDGIDRYGDYGGLFAGKVLVICSDMHAKPYHPVREYLEGCYARYGESVVGILEGIAERYFGTINSLHQLLLRKWLIGTVRRVFEPGTKFDSVLTLRGKQGSQKSS